jgi:multiple sugar transport system permease protein
MMRKALKFLATYAVLIGLGLFMLAPFAWMILISLQETKTAIPPLNKLVPEVKHWENFSTVLFMPELPVFRFFLNSVFIAVVVVLGQLFVSSLAAYGFSRLRFKGREALFTAFLLSMMFGGTVTQIPVFLMVRSFGWLDSYAALIVPGLSSAFSIFLLRQFFAQIPNELSEAARIDGAGEFRIYWSVVMPLSRAALATAAAFSFFAVWTDFFWPLLATSSVQMRTLEVGLSVFKNSYGTTNWPMQMAAALIVMVPCVVVFLATQRYFVKGVTLGGLK